MTDDTRKKAESGDAAAQYNLGLMYDNGEGVPKDDAEAVKWYRLAADQGHAQAQWCLGWSYFWGRDHNHKKAVRWYRLAADQGHALAQYYLANMYRMGWGVWKNAARAEKWYRLAAEQGLAEEQNKLGRMYFFGEVVSRDLVQAHVWCTIASAKGHEDAKKFLADCEREMTSKQKAEAMKLAREMFARIAAKKK